jgi:hypothetical protein
LATRTEMMMCAGSLLASIATLYFGFFMAGLITTICERGRIHTRKRWRVFTNLFTYPFFMLTYIPICVIALFKKVEWVPTKHDIAVSFDEVTEV